MSDTPENQTPETEGQDAAETPAEEKPAPEDAPKAEAEAKEEAKEEAGKEGLDLDDLGGDDMAAAMAAEEEAAAATAPRGGDEASLEAVYDIPVTVSAVLGNTHMHIHELLKLGRGAVVELDRKVGEAIDIYVNDRLVARGEVVIVDDKLGVTMTEIVKSRK